MGGLFSSSIDMGLLGAALVRDYNSGTSSFDPEKNVILSGDKARDMMGATSDTRVPIPANYPQYANGQHYGFGTFIKEGSGHTFVQHGGGGPGNSHTFIMEPEAQWAVDLSLNSWLVWNNQEQSVGKKRLVEIIIECYFSGYAHDVYDGVGNANGGKGTLVGQCTGTL